MYLVKTGAVKIIGRAPEGCEVILALLTPGDIFGELALMGDDGPQDHRAEAADDSLLCEVPRGLLARMIQEAPAFGWHVTKLIGLRLRTLRTRVEELLGKSAPARLAHAILQLSHQHGIQDNGGILIRCDSVRVISESSSGSHAKRSTAFCMRGATRASWRWIGAVFVSATRSGSRESGNRDSDGVD